MCCFIWPNDTLNKQVLHPACLLHSYYLSTFFSIFAFIFSFLPTIGRYDKIIISHKRLSLSWSKPTTNEVKRKGEKRRREDQQQEGREEEGRAQYILHMDYVTKKTIIISYLWNPAITNHLVSIIGSLNLVTWPLQHQESMNEIRINPNGKVTEQFSCLIKYQLN